jgi:hypothetical protein
VSWKAIKEFLRPDRLKVAVLGLFLLYNIIILIIIGIKSIS